MVITSPRVSVSILSKILFISYCIFNIYMIYNFYNIIIKWNKYNFNNNIDIQIIYKCLLLQKLKFWNLDSKNDNLKIFKIIYLINYFILYIEKFSIYYPIKNILKNNKLFKNEQKFWIFILEQIEIWFLNTFL